MESSFLSSSIKQFEYYKSLGDKTFEQLNFVEIQKEFVKESNSISIIVKHMAGNMLSRWTNFMTEDGEKPWRHRDQEFVESYASKQEVIKAWENGWDCVFNALKPLTNDDLEKIIYIRNQGHTVTEAINRQLCHYAYHIGQIVFLENSLKKTNGNPYPFLKVNPKISMPKNLVKKKVRVILLMIYNKI